MSDEYLDLTEQPEQPVETPVEEVVTEETAPVTTEEGEKDAETTEEGDKPKGKTGSQRQKERAERFRQELEQTRLELEQIKRQIAPPATKTNSDEPPKLDDFDSLEAYVAAQADFVAGKRLSEYQYQQLEQQARQQNAEFNRTFDARMNEIKAADPQADEAIEEYVEYAHYAQRAAPAVAQAVGSAIAESEIGPELVVELGKRPELMELMVSRSPLYAVKELGKLEAQLLAAKKHETPKPKTNAPRPPEPVRAVPAVKPKGGDGITLYR